MARYLAAFVSVCEACVAGSFVARVFVEKELPSRWRYSLQLQAFCLQVSEWAQALDEGVVSLLWTCKLFMVCDGITERWFAAILLVTAAAVAKYAYALLIRPFSRPCITNVPCV